MGGATPTTGPQEATPVAPKAAPTTTAPEATPPVDAAKAAAFQETAEAVAQRTAMLEETAKQKQSAAANPTDSAGDTADTADTAGDTGDTASDTAGETGDTATPSTTPASTETTPVLDATATPAAEVGWTEQITNKYNELVAKGSSGWGAALGTIPTAITAFAKNVGGMLKSAGEWLKGSFTGVTDWVSGLFGKKKEDETPAAPSAGTKEVFPLPSDDFDLNQIDQKPTEQLTSVLAANPTWLGFSQDVYKDPKIGGIPPAVIFAFIKAESTDFNPNSQNPKSTAGGLGQFIDGTWDLFLAANPAFAGTDRTDPKASIYAISWYCKTNAKECGIDTSTSNPNLAAELYIAHHNGGGGYKEMKRYLKGEFGDNPPTVPGTYLGSEDYARYGVPKIQNYADYAKAVTRMAARVQNLANLYAPQCPNEKLTS